MDKHIARKKYLQYLLEILLTAAIYFVLARLSLLVQYNSSNATPIWPPSGFAFAMIILYGYRLAPGIMLGAIAANIAVFLSNKTCDIPTAITLSSIIGIGNLTEALTGYFLLKKIVTRDEMKDFFSKVKNIFWFLGIALLMCLVSPTIGATLITAAHIIPYDQYSLVWLTWWLGDFSGVLLFTPFLLVWIYFLQSGDPIYSKVPERNVEVLLFFPVVVLSSGIIFCDWFLDISVFNFAFWMIPVVVWSALRFDIGVVVTYVMVSSLIAVWGTLHKHGPFSIDSLNESLLTLQAFIAITVVTSLTLSASVAERKRTELKLRDAGNELEKRVEERTAALGFATTQLIEQNRELERMNAELKSFSYIASHDLQEPLRKIQTIAMRIMDKEHEALSETGKDYFNRLNASASRMQKLIEDLLSYSRTNLGEHRFELIHLRIIVDEIKEEFKEILLQKSATIETNELSEVNVIPFQFHQLLYNLISNSLKFSTDERTPRININSEITEGKKLGYKDLSANKNYCHITVTDNGIGFDYRHHDRIFEIFQRLHNTHEYPGTGVGLAICKKIVENHNGFITVESEPGKGTTFYIAIPV